VGNRVTRILVVDDEPLVLQVMVRGLQAAGYEVVAAGDGVDALAKAQEQPFDLVVVDSIMPRMGGPELVIHLRSLQPGIPVLHVTGYLNETRLLERYPRNVPTIGKPFNLKLFLQKVSDLLARSRASPATGDQTA
jgi:CheY-like chemotaxis protein